MSFDRALTAHLSNSQQATNDRRTGVVLFFNGTFGFASMEDGGPDVFLHRSEVERAGLRSLNANDRIEFTVQAPRNGKGKPIAINLRAA